MNTPFISFVRFVSRILSVFIVQSVHAVISPADPSSVQAGIVAAYQAGQTSVTVPAGTYMLPPLSNSSWHLYFKNMSDFTIDATDAVFVCTDRTKRAIAFENCTGVTMTGGTFLRQTIPFSQGVIQAIATDRSSVEIVICAGYPTDIKNLAFFDLIPVFNVYDGTSRRLKSHVPDIYVARVPGGTAPKIDDLGGNRFRFHLKTPLPASSPIMAGDYAAWRGTVLPDFGVRVCQGMKFNGITIKGGAGYCFGENCGLGNNEYTNCTVTYPETPSGATVPPLLSSNADGFNSGGVRVGPKVTNCLFEGLDDDGITVHGIFGLVTESVAGNEVIINGPSTFNGIPFAAVGDLLNFYDTNGSGRGSATITGIIPLTGYTPPQPPPPSLTYFTTHPPQYYRVTFDGTVAATTHWQLSNADMIGAGFKITGCVVRDQRAHGMFMQSAGGVIQDCVVSTTVGGGIVIYAQVGGSWGQSDFANNVSVLNNTLSEVGLAQEAVNGSGLTIAAYAFGQFVPLPAGHHNVLVAGNRFEGIHGVNILVSSSDNVQIVGNSFVGPMAASAFSDINVGVDLGALIWITQSTNTLLSGNTVASPGPYMTKMVGATSTASGTGFTTGIAESTHAVAHFSGGNAAVIDGYPGAVGGGWLDTWKTLGNSASISATVSSASPFQPSSGNRLSAVVASSAAGGGAAVYRQFNGTSGGVDVAQSHSFFFDFRAETIPTGSRYAIFNRVGGGAAGTDSNDTWLIQASSSGWQLFDGNRNGGGSPVSTTLGALVAGRVYRFVVNVDPATKSWSAVIDDGINTYASPVLGFRANSTSDGTYLGFAAQNIGTAATASFSYSVDNLSISPTAIAHFSGGSAAVIDGCPGVAGGGWLDTWKTLGNSANISATVSSASPLQPSSGNRLSAVVTSSAAGGGAAVYRQFNGTSGGINVAQSHRFFFDFRPDTVPTGSRYAIFNRVGGGAAGTDSSDTWLIQASSAGWQLFNGNRNGGGSPVSTTLGALVAGRVYRFAIDVDPATRSWSAVIDDGTNTYASPVLGFRANSTSDGTYLGFAAQNTGTAATASFSYSVDNIAILP